LQVRNTVSPTSGNAVVNGLNLNFTINQTGGANGITRGLYVNPTLTAAADWRSIEWSNNTGWGLYGAGTASNYLNGNLLIGSTSDGGQKLQVTGNSFFTGNTTNQGALTIRADSNNIMQISSPSAAAKQILLTYTGGITYGLDIQTNLSQQTGVGNGYGVRITNIFNATYTTGTFTQQLIAGSFIPTSGTGLYTFLTLAATINQGGGANGITRGLYINPTLTFAADWRAIEVSSGGAYINTTSVQASAILQADSTTKGFLPPRMTNAQRTAISSPAVGLIVYCTDAVEGLYVYKSMGWTFII
jgi:hypothetical protein